MKKLITAFLVLVTVNVSAQCETSTYIGLAQKVFDGNLTEDDFLGNLFVTIDTVNSNDLNAPSIYTECSNATQVLQIFNSAMSKIKVEGSFFNYYEMHNSSFFPSPLHQTYLINDATSTYLVSIWNNPTDITKIEGLTIGKFDRVERTPY